ncbi:hypothetical protein V6N00_10950 [Tersicoccus sp. MR15.9]|uniref:hypothetical protein n=1 Tax=Tersicoccus mangrovi TaxID=3121635 RepID=UPI002FE68AC6
MKFDMGAQTLSTLTNQTSTNSEDLGSLVRKLVADVTPLEGKFNGSGRARFDDFKHRTDEIANELNNSLGAILEGQGGMDTAFQTGDQEAADNATQSQGSADFSSADFRSRRA